MAPLSNLRNRIAPAERERGAVLVLTALVMMLLLFIAAFATDLGAWYRQGQEQQRAADVGALNGVQAYDSAVKGYWDELNNAVPAPATEIKRWNQLSLAQAQEAERRGLQAAAQTIIGVLESSGLTFSDVGSGVLAADPRDPALLQTSIWTVVADDGTEIVITRSFQQTGVDASGNPVYSRAIDVQVVAPGEQYFSNIIREAPEITRTASSVLSNCGAVCTQEITIDPPFAGFDAAGSGDGFKPLLYGDTEIWAVNHHVYSGWEGDIVCMDRDTQAGCTPQAAFPLVGYNTATFPVELLSNSVNKIYAPSTSRASGQAGLLCFDVARKQWCTTKFIGFSGTTWQSNNDWSSPAVGVWEYGGNAWVLNHKGRIACVTTSTNASGGMQPCGEYDTAIVGHSRVHTGTNNRTAWGEIVGHNLYLISRGQGNDALFHCFNLNSQQPCWGGSVVRLAASNFGAGQTMGFIRHATNGSTAGFCLTVPQRGNHHCVNFSGNNMSAIPSFAASQTPLVNFDTSPTNTSPWTGAVYTWEGKRSFFNGGNSDRLTCYSWESPQGPCGEVDLDQIVPGNSEVRSAGPRVGSQEIEPYNLAQVTPFCLVGLGDQSIFFSFNPATLQSCVDTTLSADIEPCECTDGGNRWGAVRLPESLLTKVALLEATVTDAATGTQYIVDEDLLTPADPNDRGVLDLTGVPSSVNLLKLDLRIDALLDVNGDPLWVDPIYADLQITVQPTLAS